MAWKYYPAGKDEIAEPGIEIDGESFHSMDELEIALFKALIKKGIITKQEILNEL
jgi:hypothetical protein